jgi:hypothetical protein
MNPYDTGETRSFTVFHDRVKAAVIDLGDA